MVTKFLLLIAFLAIVRGEVGPASGRRAPYAPAGWHPRVPFNLPNEYVPPVRQTVEITKARVDQIEPVNTPQSNYLPPQQLDISDGEILPSSRPAKQYGPPHPKFKIIYPDEEEPTTLRISVDNQQPKIREGRYFVISQDNKLQKVTFSSQQNGEDEDFTAQLSYSTVGQLKDPVYRYNNQGQLERVLK